MSKRQSATEAAELRMVAASELSNRASNRTNRELWQRAAADYWVTLHPELARLRGGDTDATTNRDIGVLAEQIRLAEGASERGRPARASKADSKRMAQIGWLHEVLAALYDSVGLAIEQLRSGDARGIGPAIQFLEADPYCFRSGYMKQEVIRFLVRSKLGETEIERLRQVVLAVVDGDDRREFRAYIRLARRVDRNTLRTELRERSKSPDRRTSRHAMWMLAGLEASRTDSGLG